MGKSLLEVLLKGTDQLSQPTSKARETIDDLTEATIRLIKAEKQAAVNKEAEEHFKKMSQAEKDAALQAYNLSAAEAKLAAEADRAAKTAGDQTNGFRSLAGGLNEVVTGLTGFNLAQIASVGTIIAVGNEIKKAVTNYSDYVSSVDKASQATGVNVEEMSRLMQLADDFTVEQSSLENAMKIAMKNGFQPTVENIAKLSDEYRSIQDPTERAAMLTKIFGKSWEDLVPMLQKGGDAIRNASKDIDDSLIVTDKAVAQNRLYKLALDDWGDTWTGIENRVAMGAMPALTVGIDTLTGVLQKNTQDLEQHKLGWDTLVPALKYGKMWYEQLTGAMDEQAQKQKEMISLVRAQSITNTEATQMQRWKAQASQDAAAAADAEAQSVNAVGVTYQDFNPVLRANIDLTTQQREDFNGIAEATAKIDEATKNYEQTLKDWQGGVGSQLAGMLDENKLKTDKYKDALGIIDKTMGTNLKTESDQKDALKDLAEKYNTGKITGDEFGKKLVEIRDQFAPLNDKIAEAKTKLDELYAQIDKFSDLSINVNVNYSENGGSTGGSMGYTGQSGDANGNVSTERALGGPVGAGTYIVGENGPEVLQLNPGSSGNVINHYNATYNVNAHYPMQRPGSVRDDIIALTMRHNIGASRWMA